MLRPMVATTAVTAALILVAGCGGNDKKSESGSENKGGESTTSATPTAPTAPSFDPPKAFAPAAAFPEIEEKGRSTSDESQMSIAGQVALTGSWAALDGHDVADPKNTWTVPSTEAETTQVFDSSKPVGVKVDGKDVAVVAYAMADKGNGTQKPSGLVLVQWVDVMTGKKIAEVSTKVSTLEGGNNIIGNPSLSEEAYDPETGQVAFGMQATGTPVVNAKELTLFADPKTQKSTLIPGVRPAAVHDGVVAASKGTGQEGSHDGTVVLVDGASGKVTKQIPLKKDSLDAVAGGTKHAYFVGDEYVPTGEYDGTHSTELYAVDLSTGAVVKTLPALPRKDAIGYTCISDQAAAVVCSSYRAQAGDEIIGFDDTTGKKAWGFTSLSGGRVIPEVTTAFHGVVYARTEAQPVLLDAKTGADLPSGSSSSSPSSSNSPSSSDTPSSGDTPSESSGNESPGNGDMGLFDGKMQSPDSVSPYGGVYRQLPTSTDYGSTVKVESICIFLKPTA